MKLAHISCAFGRHKVDESAIRRVHGGQVGRCRYCTTLLEESSPYTWTKLQVHDAGLGGRFLN